MNKYQKKYFKLSLLSFLSFIVCCLFIYFYGQFFKENVLLFAFTLISLPLLSYLFLVKVVYYEGFTDEEIEQSPIPIHIRVAMSEEVGKPRSRKDINCPFLLSNKERENKNDNL